VFTPPPVPTAERLAARPAWLDDQSPAAPSPPRDERGAIDPAAAPAMGPSQARAVWYDPAGEAAPGMEQLAAPRSPLSPVVSPRGERRSRFLGPLLAALLLVLVVGGVAFAVEKARDGNNQRTAADATHTAQAAALASTPVATTTTAAQVVETPTIRPENAAAAPKATDTVESTQTPAPAAVASPTKSAPTATAKTGAVRAADLLPDVSVLPAGFAQTADDKYTKDQMIAQLGENGAQLVDQWKWRENAYRYFEIPASANPDPKGASSVTVSVHRFASKSGATAALKGLADILAGSGYQEVSVAKIGDQARALKSETADGNLYVLYVRTGNFVIRLGGYSVSGDSSNVVIALAKKIVNG
jgi:hypothetical protein